MQYYVIPPKRNAEFVVVMERVLDTYHLPYDPKVSVIVMDEQPVQLFKETRTPIPATRHHAKRVADVETQEIICTAHLLRMNLVCAILNKERPT